MSNYKINAVLIRFFLTAAYSAKVRTFLHFIETSASGFLVPKLLSYY